MTGDDGIEFKERWIAREFGDWLRERRRKKGFNLEHVSLETTIPLLRLEALEVGASGDGLSSSEIRGLSIVYGIDARAIRMRILSAGDPSF